MDINVNKLTSLKVTVFETFLAIVEQGSFCNAADVKALSPAAVTAQVKQLEEIVGQKIFIRSGKEQAELTEAGVEVLKFARIMVEGIQSLKSGLKHSTQSLSGTVKYAMPHSCLLSPHFSMLLERRREFPLINLVVNLMLNEEVLALIKENKADFGFVTEKIANPKLVYKEFCQEEYVLVSAGLSELDNLTSETILNYSFVEYPGFDQFFTLWKEHYLPDLRNVSAASLNSPNRFSLIDGAIKMVVGGLGLSIFPRHTVQHHLESGELKEYQSDKEPVLNNIYIIQHLDAQKNERVKMVIQWFLDMHAGDCE